MQPTSKLVLALKQRIRDLSHRIVGIEEIRREHAAQIDELRREVGRIPDFWCQAGSSTGSNVHPRELVGA